MTLIAWQHMHLFYLHCNCKILYNFSCTMSHFFDYNNQDEKMAYFKHLTKHSKITKFCVRINLNLHAWKENFCWLKWTQNTARYKAQNKHEHRHKKDCMPVLMKENDKTGNLCSSNVRGKCCNTYIRTYTLLLLLHPLSRILTPILIINHPLSISSTYYD